jgi:O-antigen/teichoic acid export membrane protein
LFAYAITSGVILINIRKYIKFKFDKFWIYRLTNYGVYTIIGSVAFVIYTNIDQIVINTYMSTENVGIYKAYCFASMNVASIIFGIFSNVFIPVASKCKDKTILLKKINKITPFLIVFGIPAIIFVEYVILNLYGGEYPINLSLIILFAIVSILVGYYGMHDWIYSSEGMAGVKLVSKSSVIIAIVNIFLDICLIPQIGLFGAIISTAIALMVGIFFLLKRGKILLSPNCVDSC